MVKMKDETDTCAKRKRFWVNPNKLQTDTVQSLLSANVIYQPERTMMSINDATPQDWDRLRKQHPPLVLDEVTSTADLHYTPQLNPTFLETYIALAEEELTEGMEATEWWKQHVARKEQAEYEARWVDESLEEIIARQDEEEEDVVNNPNHYNNGSIECIEGIQASMSAEAFAGYLKGNCMKYLWRYNYKGKPVQDLQKAQWYLAELIKELVFEHE
jgi:hypothetical protein